MPFSRVVSCLVAVTLALSACSDDTSTSPVSPALSVTPPPQASAVQTPRTLDDEFAQVAREEVPGFAGYFLDKSGVLVVRVVGEAGVAAARQYGERRAERSVGMSKSVRVESAEFDYTQLLSWETLLLNAVDPAGEFAVDIDEVNNRIWAAAPTAAQAEAVRAAAARVGIPNTAIDVVSRALPAERVVRTLQDYHPVKEGGIQIQNANYGYCTLGFNASYQGMAVFVTNSHCTQYRWSLTHDVLYQNTNLSANAVGTEVWDRALYHCISPWGPLCRYSDAALVEYASGISYNLGYLKPHGAYVYGTPGSLTVPNYTPSIPIVAKWTSTIPVGAPVGKVGRTTGPTIGNVLQSCVTISNGTGFYICQYISDVYSDAGDSGSPILIYNTPNTGGETLAGILYGGPPGVPTETWFSPVSGIERDLGSTLTVCVAGYGC